MCLEGGERIDSSMKNYLRKVMDKRRRWMGLGTRTKYIVCTRDGLQQAHTDSLLSLTTDTQQALRHGIARWTKSHKVYEWCKRHYVLKCRHKNQFVKTRRPALASKVSVQFFFFFLFLKLHVYRITMRGNSKVCFRKQGKAYSCVQLHQSYKLCVKSRRRAFESVRLPTIVYGPRRTLYN